MSMPDSVCLMWFILMVVFLVIEAFTLGLTTVWFAGGALVALVLAFCGFDIQVQLIAFTVVSVALLFLVRPSACRKFNSKRMKTDLGRIVGAEGKVLQTIDNFKQTGCVWLDGKEWTARSADGTIIQEGARVTVNEITGVKLIVTENETINQQTF